MIFIWGQKLLRDGCAWRDDADDFALHQALCLGGVFGLFTDGDFVSCRRQFIQIGLIRSVRDSAHGDCVGLAFVARGQRNLQDW